MIALFVSAIKSFSPKEFSLFLIGSALALLSGVLVLIQTIHERTVVMPAYGGSFIEGNVGQAAYLNPILARENSPDKDTVVLLFASVYDLAETIEHDELFRTWDIRIKEGSCWHDETIVTSDDIVFTVQTIQDANTASPLASSWQNITVERVSEREVRFKTTHSFALFENLLKELRPVPKKYFADLSSAHIRLSAYNLRPIGSGPFRFESIDKRADGFITSITMARNEAYEAIGKKPFIEKFTLVYFENENALIRAFNKGTIDGFGTFTPNIGDFIELGNRAHLAKTSRYYATFLNQNAQLSLKSEYVRKALALFTDTDAIVKNVFKGYALPQSGPLPIQWYEKNGSTQQEHKNTQGGRQLLEKDGWFFDEQTTSWNKTTEGVLKKLQYIIKIPDSLLIQYIAEEIQRQWKEQGIYTTIQKTDPREFTEKILKTRDYEIIIYGNVLMETPDLTSFWHSQERFYPGLNFSLFQDAGIDELLSRLRSLDQESSMRNEALKTISEDIISQTPAVFLASPYYIYFTRSSTLGVAIDKISTLDTRFTNISGWHAKTKRVSR